MNAKAEFGQVLTPEALVSAMLDLMPVRLFSDPGLKWMDPGAGKGAFSKELERRLVKGLGGGTRAHIQGAMLHMWEIQTPNIASLRAVFPLCGAIHHGDFLSAASLGQAGCYDCVVGNPPFNSGGLPRVPTWKGGAEDGLRATRGAVWPDFIKRSLVCLKPDGYLLMIVPGLWLRPGKRGIHDLLFGQRLLKIVSLSSSQTQSVFKGEAQTPTTVIFLQKAAPRPSFLISSGLEQQWMRYPHSVLGPTPTAFHALHLKLRPFLQQFGHISLTKTSTCSKRIRFQQTRGAEFQYPSISTCRLVDGVPTLVLEYADAPCFGAGRPKVVLAHKMHGYPYVDSEGTFGVSKRDSYVFFHNEPAVLAQVGMYLSSRLAHAAFASARYRMRYLEREAFVFLPDPLALAEFPVWPTDEAIAQFFQFDGATTELIRGVGPRCANARARAPSEIEPELAVGQDA